MKNLLRIFIIVVYVFLSLSNVYASEEAFPVITSVYPEYGASSIDTTIKISISFSGPMDKRSVEDMFYIFPEIKGKFKWDGNTLKFEPQKPLLPSTSYFVSFTSSIKSSAGMPVILTYFSTTPQALCVGPDGNIQIVGLNKQVEKLDVQGNNPVWSADNSRIVYDYEGDIWTVYSNGKQKEKLTEDETITATNPLWNPHVDLIAFVGNNAADVANIYMVEPESKIVTQLTAFFQPTTINEIKWSPDGLYCAFLRDGQIWIMDPDGNNMRRLTTDDLNCKGNFSWSPAGTKIAFSGDLNVWVGDIYSFEFRKMSFDNTKTGKLDWSKSNMVVFESEGITIMEADGSSEIQIATAGKEPLWINSGKHLSYILPLHNQENTSQLWLLSSDGLTKEKIAVIGAQSNSVAWSKNIGFKLPQAK
ncbi:MAG: Ig-like domain-containing protein [Candidatus Omnitrophota bacterium]